MGEAIGGILAMAVGVAISPFPIIAIVLMLGTPRARVNGPGFALGWLLGLSVVGAVVLALASGRSQEESDQAKWVSVLLLLLGSLFVLLAVRTWRRRPRGGREAEIPKWIQAVDRFTAAKSLAAGVILSALNPKNLALTVAAAAAIAAAGLSTGGELGTLAVFILLGSLSILTPLAIYFAMGERAVTILGGLKNWMAAHNAAIMTVLLLVLGAKLTGDAIRGFAS